LGSEGNNEYVSRLDRFIVLLGDKADNIKADTKLSSDIWICYMENMSTTFPVKEERS
jgi:hypothetical protein